MLVRKTVPLNLLFFYTYRNILYSAIIATAVYLAHTQFGMNWQIPMAVVATLGTALAIFLAFKNNAAYDRWWEARKIWGGIVNISRTFGQQVVNFFEGESELKKEIIFRHLAWMNGLRMQLRNQRTSPEWESTLSQYLPPEEFLNVSAMGNPATQLVKNQGERMAFLLQKGLVDPIRHMRMDQSLQELYSLQGKTERIKNTPIPRGYDHFTRLFLNAFILLLPLGIIQPLGDVGVAWMVLPLTIFLGWAFFVMHRIGSLLEKPFENIGPDVAVTAICRTVEIDLLEMLAHDRVPPKLEPVNGILM